jgi:Holliday junction resolvase RusA-like endonuclease
MTPTQGAEDMIELAVTVPGEPEPQGAISGGGQRTSKNGRTYHQPGYHTNGARLEVWRTAIVVATKQAMHRAGMTAPLDGPVLLRAEFALTRPKTVTREEPTVPPDLDHLERALGDALKMAGALRDDALICENRTRKRYADGIAPGVRFALERVGRAQDIADLRAAKTTSLAVPAVAWLW